ncbi:MAG: replication-associated recombination protein A [Oscillospiraceae bacterium]|nr:replication-associated recombination protein A [Oscillospiraceae bacterium]
MRQASMFDDSQALPPLAARLRPRTLEEYVGQRHLLGKGCVLRQMIDNDLLQSMIFWGPPGVGKTTLARIIAQKTQAEFINFSAVTSGIKEIKEVMAAAENSRMLGSLTILFVDEIHRFNKAQQDAFLPFVEKGSIILIGATTENPSFEINAALNSRCKVFVLKPLSVEELTIILRTALADKRGFGDLNVEISDEKLSILASLSDGDARAALSALELAVKCGRNEGDKIVVTNEALEQSVGRKTLLYDKNGEEHYNIISALHKSMRNSDPDAGVYWLSRMLEAGENPLYIARRIVRFASEDIGLADSNALQVSVAAYQACHFLGMPECGVHLTHATVYCALAPKSNAAYMAYERARQDALETLSEPVPLQIRNAPTRLMRELDYGKEYLYAHNFENKIANMQCLPDALADSEYYAPTDQGREAKIKEWLTKIREWRKQYSGST